MTIKFSIHLFSAMMIFLSVLASSHVQAENSADLRFTLSDFRLNSAQDLVDVCTVIPSDEHYVAAISFCFGFFEGAVHYDEVVSHLDGYRDLVCPPPQATRQQAVSKFIHFMKENPQHGSEQPVDAIFRSLVDSWPCEDTDNST